MATTYILAGGGDVRVPVFWDKLGEAIHLKRPIKVLSCQFAQSPEEWQERFESFTPYFQRAFGKDMTSVLATMNEFDQQVQQADVIYLHGGQTEALKSCLDRVSDVEKLFADKVVIGSSAGAQFLSQKYWSCGIREVGVGHGIVPLNIIVHYGSTHLDDDRRGPVNWESAKQELQQVIGNVDIIPLPEGEFIVFKK